MPELADDHVPGALAVALALDLLPGLGQPLDLLQCARHGTVVRSGYVLVASNKRLHGNRLRSGKRQVQPHALLVVGRVKGRLDTLAVREPAVQQPRELRLFHRPRQAKHLCALALPLAGVLLGIVVVGRREVMRGRVLVVAANRRHIEHGPASVT